MVIDSNQSCTAVETDKGRIDLAAADGEEQGRLVLNFFEQDSESDSRENHFAVAESFRTKIQ